MPISFTAAERLAITRRQVRIALENAGFQTSINSYNGQQAALLQVDTSNAKFYDYYNTIVQAYENEVRHINGIVADVYLAGDIPAAAQTPTIPPFFPTSPLPAYPKNIPLIQDGIHTNNKVKGFFHPTSTDILHEQNLLPGLQTTITFLLGGAGTSSDTTSTSIPAGPVTGLVLSLPAPPTFNIGDLIYAVNGANYGVYIVTNTSTAPDTITVNSVIVAQSAIASGSNISSQVVDIQTAIFNYVTFWQSKLNSQNSALSGQQDERSPQITQNAAAVTSINNALAIINPWLLAPTYTAPGLAPIQAQITARITQVTTRIAEITTALGGSSANSLSQSGDSYSTSSPNNPYFNRYKWLNFRINRASGSLRRYYSANQSKDAVQTLLNDNNTIKGEYDAYFLTKPITFNDGSDILHLKDLTGLANGNTLTIVSETQPEITRTIVQLMGTTQVKLNAPVPTTYKLEDVARAFKTL